MSFEVALKSGCFKRKEEAKLGDFTCQSMNLSATTVKNALINCARLKMTLPSLNANFAQVRMLKRRCPRLQPAVMNVTAAVSAALALPAPLKLVQPVVTEKALNSLWSAFDHLIG